MRYNRPENTTGQPVVLSMKMLETPATAPMYRRKMQSNINDRTIRMYEDASRGGQLHSETLLARIANSALHYAQDCEYVDLPGGYNDTRYRVIIEFLEGSMGSSENVSYITGYTDHMDCSSGDRPDFDQEMRFYFNEIRTLSQRGGNNLRNNTIRSVRDTSQILSRIDDNALSGRSRYDSQNTHLMTPGVVTQVMQADVLHQSLGLMKDEIEINDSRTSLMMHNNYRSQASNRVRSTFLTRVMGGYAKATTGRLDGSRENISILADAVHHSGDASIASSHFFEALIADTDYDAFGYVTWRELKRCFPELLDSGLDIDVHPLSQDRISRSFGLDNITPWNDNTLETVISNITVSGIPAMMPDLLFEEITFVAHNDTVDGSIYVFVENYATLYDDLDRTEELKILESRIQHHLYAGCDFVDNIMFHVQGTISTLFECELAVSVDDADEQVYRYPSYAAALGTSLVSSDQTDVYHIADDMRKLMDVVDASVEERQQDRILYVPPSTSKPRNRGGI